MKFGVGDLVKYEGFECKILAAEFCPDLQSEPLYRVNIGVGLVPESYLSLLRKCTSVKFYAIVFPDGTIDEDNIFLTKEEAENWLSIVYKDPDYYGLGWCMRELETRILSDREGTF
jgi:hypothetical protein